MPFPVAVADQVLLSCGRRCCICNGFCGTKIELHHIVPQTAGGPDTAENCIPLCFNCHAEVGHYNQKHPKGRKFSASELRRLRDRCYLRVASFNAPVQSRTPDGQRLWGSVAQWKVSVPLILTVQWIAVSYLVSANGGPVGAAYTFIAPLWIILLSVGISQVLKEEPFSAALAGAVTIGIVSAWLGTLMADWMAPDGLVIGAYFGGGLSFHFASPRRRMHILVIVALTILLFTGLGVFTHLNFFSRVHPEAFAPPALSVLLGASIVLLVRSWDRYRQSVNDQEKCEHEGEEDQQRLT